MPYISEDDRKHIDSRLAIITELTDYYDGEFVIEEIVSALKTVPSGKTKGAFNYFVSRLFLQTFKHDGYTDTSDALSVFVDMEAELRRRLMEPIENRAIEKNGDLPELIEKPIYYKVCRIYENKYYSFNPRPSQDDIRSLEYELGKTTVPKLENSKLMVFDSLENAQKFRQNLWLPLPESCIFKVNAENVSVAHNMSYNGLEVRDFWANKPTVYKVTPPTGTLYADSVTLLEKIESF
jgi:hypothetical protein